MHCHQCGKELPQDAKFCLGCGTALAVVSAAGGQLPKVPSKPTNPWLVILGIVALGIFGIFALWFIAPSNSLNSSSSVSKPIETVPSPVSMPVETEPVETAIPVSAYTLFADYLNLRGDKYRGQPILITGVVARINKDNMPDPDFLSLAASKKNQFEFVRTELRKGEEGKAATLISIGSVVTLLCRGNAGIVPNPPLKDCIIRGVSAAKPLARQPKRKGAAGLFGD